MKRFWTIFFQVIWILIWPVIAGLIYYFLTKNAIAGIDDADKIKAIEKDNSKYFYITLIDIIGFIDLVWYIMVMRTQQSMDILTTVGNLMILDIPAYFFAKKSFEQNKQKELEEAKQKSTYKKAIASAKEEQELLDDDALLSSWEKEQLKKKKPKEYEKVVKKERTTDVVDYEVETTRKIIRGFGVYVLSLIYKKNPKIVNTYQIITKYKDMIQKDKKKLATSFSKVTKMKLLIHDYDAKVMTAKRITDAVIETEQEEFGIALKQDRVQMQIDAKNYLAKTKQKQIG